MLFQELCDTLGENNEEKVRGFLAGLDLPINPKARIIPDQYVDEILELYKKSQTSRKEEAESPKPTTPVIEDAVIISKAPTVDDLFTFKKQPSEQEQQEDKYQEKLKKFVKPNPKKIDTKSKPKQETILNKSDQGTLRHKDFSSLRLDDFQLDIEDEDTPLQTNDEEENTTALVERIQREQDKELQRQARAKKQKEEEEEAAKMLDPEILAERERQRRGEMMKQRDEAVIPDVITVKEFSEKIGIPPSQVIKSLLKNGVIVTINHKIDFDTAALIGEELGVKIQKEQASFSSQDLVQGNLAKLLEQEDESLLTPRPPIVSIMGHVDHGKTSLLDYIRKSKIASGEAGGITQAIGAYQVDLSGKKITFLDTPGHEAFTAMRARGAKATDIAILVVAADEGVKPQTIEAINHAREAHIPILVALNKIDKEAANIDRVKAELAEYNLVPEDWGGETIMTPVSAHTGEGIDTLLEMILLVSEMQNLRANTERDALGTIIETHLDQSLGPVATVLVNTGILHLGDNFVCGESYGRIKIMSDSKGKKLKEALPSTPVRIAGLSETPQVGDILQVLPNEKQARDKAIEVKSIRASSGYKSSTGLAFNDLITRISQGELKKLKIVLKADTLGSLEAVRAALLKLNTEEVEVVIIHSGVGNFTETDVLMSSASQGLIIGFNVDVPAQVQKASEKMNVTIKTYRVIYHLTDEIRKLLSGLLDPEIREIRLGDFEVLKVFFTSKKYQIIGGKVIRGKLEAKGLIRVIRGDKLIGEGVIDSLQKGNDSVQEIGEGYECGMRFVGKCSPEEKDIFEVYKLEHITRTL